MSHIHIPYIYIRRLDDINVRACACDLLYRTVTKFSFLMFRAMAYIRLRN